MHIRFQVSAVCLLLAGIVAQAGAVCDPADQIAPNPNPDGATLTITSGTACNAADPYENLGTLNNEGALVNEGSLANGVVDFSDSTLNNYGTLVNKGFIGGSGLTGSVNNYGTWIMKVLREIFVSETTAR
jgi:hypothetical protein